MKVYKNYFRSPVSATGGQASGLGWLEIVISENKIVDINFVNKNRGGNSHPYFKIVKKQLTEYFAGKRKKFTLRLDIVGTVFQIKVWKAMSQIPFGKTLTYGQLARKVGRPGASRAVGTACRLNKIPIIIPCHRVIPSSGGIGQYAEGADKKKLLLELEA